MPEGPEVRRSADGLHDALAGQPILDFRTRIKTARAWLEGHPDAFTGRRISRVVSHGKHLLGYVEDALYFHSHFMMWGRWLLVDPDDEQVHTPDRRERARVVTPDRVALLFSAPVFKVGRGDPYADDALLATLGPDVLPYSGAFDAARFRERLLAPEQRTRTIGALLLDQTVCAGLGNYLRAEILFLCRIDPWQRAEDLTPEALDALDQTIPAVARRAYLHTRTVPEAVQEKMAADPRLVYNPGRPWNTRHFVFRRTNLPCLQCNDHIRQKRQITRRIDDEVKTRIIYFCPTCQNTTVDVNPPKPRMLHG